MSMVEQRVPARFETRVQSSFTLNPQDELNDLRMSEKALPLLEIRSRFSCSIDAERAQG